MSPEANMMENNWWIKWIIIVLTRTSCAVWVCCPLDVTWPHAGNLRVLYNWLNSVSNTKFITLGISLSWIEWSYRYINVGTLCIHNQGDDKLCKLQVTASLCYMRKACLALHLYLLMGNLCFGSRLMNYSYSQ